MRWFVRRLAVVTAVAFVSMAAAAVATPGVSSAECGPNMSWNPVTNVCKLPPAPPAWYTPPPPYAPSFAPLDVPPPLSGDEDPAAHLKTEANEAEWGFTR